MASNLNIISMKKLHEFDFNCMYPMYVEGEKLLDASEYAAFLIRKGYALPDSVAQVASDAPEANSDSSDPKDASPLSSKNRTVADMFDEIEAQAKADFTKRGRKPKKENA